MGMSQNRFKLEQERKRRERIRRAKRRRNCAIVVFVLAIIAVVAIVNINQVKDINHEELSATAEVNIKVDTSAAKNPYTTTRAVEDIKTSFFDDTAFAGNALAETIDMYGILKRTDFYAGVNVDVDNVYTTKTVGSTTSITEQFKSKRFRKVFLAFGENELRSMSSTEFKKSYLKLIDKIEEYQPNARIYLIGIPPVTAEVSNSENDITIKKVQEFNRRIISIAVDEELYYIDSVDALGDNKGFLPKGVSYDGRNLNKAAVVDLLYYTAKEAYVPKTDDISNTAEEDEEDEEDEEEVRKDKAAAKPSDPSPSPTVNVFKDKKTETRRGTDE